MDIFRAGLAGIILRELTAAFFMHPPRLRMTGNDQGPSEANLRQNIEKIGIIMQERQKEPS
jgi:hypothetical protein